MSTILLTHFDMDGVTSAIMLSSIIKFDRIFKGAYHRIDKFIEDVPDGSTVVVSDLSLTEEQYRRLKHKSQQLTVIDHHPDTAVLKEKFPDERIHFRTDKSASLLCYELVKGTGKLSERQLRPLAALAYLADVYDLWQQTSPDWETAYKLNLLFWHLKFDDFFDEFKNGFTGFAEDQKEFLVKKKKQIRERLEATTYVELDEDGIRSLVALPEHASLNNEVPGYKPGYDVYYIINKFKDSMSMSVRSTRLVVNTACESLVENGKGVLNGGGHDLAAGVGLDPNMSTDGLQYIILTLNKKIVDMNC